MMAILEYIVVVEEKQPMTDAERDAMVELSKDLEAEIKAAIKLTIPPAFEDKVTVSIN